MHHSNTGPHTFANDSPDAIPDATPDAIPGSTLHAISDTTPYTSANASSKPIQLPVSYTHLTLPTIYSV